MSNTKLLTLSALLVIGLWLLLGVAVDFKDSGGRFAPVNALFSGLAFAALVVTLRLQQSQIDGQKLQLLDQKRQLVDTMFSTRLDALVEHHRVFVESSSKSSRRFAWACIQRSWHAPDFRNKLAAFSHVPLAASHVAIDGMFRSSDRPRDQPTPWHDAAHAIDEILSYFAILAARIVAVEVVIRDDDARLREFRALVRGMNVYWAWWGPSLRYVSALRKQHAKDRKDRIFGWIDYSRDFDLLDRYLLQDDASSGGDQGQEMLRILCRDPIWWCECSHDGQTLGTPTRTHTGNEVFTMASIGIYDWPASSEVDPQPLPRGTLGETPREASQTR